MNSSFLEFEDNKTVQSMIGVHDCNIKKIEDKFDVEILVMGNQVKIIGKTKEAIDKANEALNIIYDKLDRNIDVDDGDIDGIMRIVNQKSNGKDKNMDNENRNSKDEQEIVLKTRKKHIYPRSVNQADYVRAMINNELVFGLGPAGTGKTYLAVAYAVLMLIEGKIERIILSRPAVEAGEHLGFLPGDLKEKIDPYLRPLYDAINDMMPQEQTEKLLESGVIEVAPLAFMRGRTLSNAFVILDEAQNTTVQQMKMFLTRLGENSRMVVNGDMSQTDLPNGVISGLRDAIYTLKNLKNVECIKFDDKDVVRHGLVAKIVKAYDEKYKNAVNEE